MCNEIINHLINADNLVIMAPSVAGQSKLLRMCELFGASHDMVFNQTNSASVYFISKTLKCAHLPNVYLNGEVILQVDSVRQRHLTQVKRLTTSTTPLIRSWKSKHITQL